jgi:hypothetical protein
MKLRKKINKNGVGLVLFFVVAIVLGGQLRIFANVKLMEL